MRKPSRRQIERKARNRARMAWGFALGSLYVSAAAIVATGLIGFATTL